MMSNMYAASLRGAASAGPMPLSGLGFDVGSVLETAAAVLPDAWQEAGQDVLDTVTAPVRDLAKSISPEAYAALDAIAQRQIDAARRELGLPAVSPGATNSTPTTEPGRAAEGDTTSLGTAPDGRPIGGNVGTALDHARNVYGYVGASVGLLGGWWMSGHIGKGKGRMRPTGRRVATALMMGVGVGLAAGIAGNAVTNA